MATPESSPLTTRPPQVAFTNRFVQPPSSLYIDRDDLLFIRTTSALANIVIELRGRLLTPKGHLVTLAFDHATTGSPVGSASSRFDLQEGFLLGLVASATFDTILRGELYIALALIRGGSGQVSATHQLSSGYLELGKGVTWPPGSIESPVSGRGIMRAVTGNDPAAGAEIEIGVDALVLWRFAGIRLTLTTSGVAANRRVRLVLNRDGLAQTVIPSPHVQTAGTTVNYSIAPFGFDADIRGSEVMMALPFDTYLGENDTILTSTDNLDAGDNWSAPELSVEQWLQGR